MSRLKRKRSAKNTVLFFLKKFKVLLDCKSKKKLNLHSHTPDSDFGLEELTLRNCPGLAPGRMGLSVFVLF